MTNSVEFEPRLDILPPPQRRLWDELSATPEEFTLYGGTAIALQLGHRQSIDFDFFGRKDFNPQHLFTDVPYLAGGRIVQESESTLTVWLDRGGAARVSFFGVPELGEVEAPQIACDIGLKVASLIDLAALKTVVVQTRAEAKDFIDLDALIVAGIDLSRALAAAEVIQGPSFNRHVSLKALSYFEDGNLKTLDPSVKERLQAAVQSVDPNETPHLQYNRRYGEGSK